MSMAGMVIIDSDKLINELERKDISKAEISRQMGFGGTYLSNVLARGKISKSGAQLLKSLFDIDLESYIHVEPEPEPEKKEDIEAFANCQHVIVTLNIDEIQKAVYSGVYGAIKRLVREGEL